MPCSLIEADQCFTGMFLAYLMMLFSDFDYIAWNKGNDELERLWKEVVMA
jgi:hypothetical protein